MGNPGPKKLWQRRCLEQFTEDQVHWAYERLLGKYAVNAVDLRNPVYNLSVNIVP